MLNKYIYLLKKYSKVVLDIEWSRLSVEQKETEVRAAARDMYVPI